MSRLPRWVRAGRRHGLVPKHLLNGVDVDAEQHAVEIEGAESPHRHPATFRPRSRAATRCRRLGDDPLDIEKLGERTLDDRAAQDASRTPPPRRRTAPRRCRGSRRRRGELPPLLDEHDDVEGGPAPRPSRRDDLSRSLAKARAHAPAAGSRPGTGRPHAHRSAPRPRSGNVSTERPLEGMTMRPALDRGTADLLAPTASSAAPGPPPRHAGRVRQDVAAAPGRGCRDEGDAPSPRIAPGVKRRALSSCPSGLTRCLR